MTGVRCAAAALIDLAADLGAAREAQPVEALRDQLLAHRTVTLDHGDRVAVEVPRHQLGHQRRGRGCYLGWLEQHGVSSGDRPDGRAERQREREVPGADDQHGAVRLVLDPAAAGQLRELQTPVLALAPLADVLRRDVGFASRAGDIGQPRLEGLAPEVLRERVGDGGLVVDEHPLEVFQLLLAPRDVPGAARGEGLAKTGDDGRNVYCRGG